MMDYGGNTKINASVEKEDNVIKTYLFTTFNSSNQTYKVYDYTEIRFTSQNDFEIIVLDYTYDAENNLDEKTMVYASSNKEFFLIVSDFNDLGNATVFFDMGDSSPAYIIKGSNSSELNGILGVLAQNFELSSQEKTYIGNLYNNQMYSIDYSQVTKAKTDLGILIDMDDEEYVPPVGFVSNKNAEDLVGRKTLQAFVDDGQSVVNKTLTIPEEFNYLSGGIYFQTDIDTLVIPSSIRGVVIYDHDWNYSILDDSLCYDYEGGRYKGWGGMLTSYVLDGNGEFHVSNEKPFKKFILLDAQGNPTNETEAFVLDEMGNLWLKDSQGNKNYLWGFVSEPTGDTLYLPSPTYTTINGQYIEVEHFYSGNFAEILKNVGKLDSYANTIKHLIVEGYVIEDYIPEMGIQPGFNLLRSTFLTSWEYPDGTLTGIKWDLETLTINNIIDGASVSLSGIFCGESTRYDIYNMPYSVTICQTKIKKVILNGDFETITYRSGYEIVEHIPIEPLPGGGDGMMGVIPDSGHEDRKILDTYAISEDYELNGRANAHFAYDSVVYGKKVVEIYNDDYQFPAFPDAETLVIKSSVTELNINDSFFQIGMYSLPADRKLTIEFENIAGIDFSDFEIRDFMYRDWDDPNRGWKDSNRVEKLKFNCSEAYMERFISNLESDTSASWFVDAIKSGKYIIEYSDPHPYEEEFFANFDFDGWGSVSKKETNTQTTFEINDEFLSLVKQITGQELTGLSLYDYSGAEIKVILNISKEYIDKSGIIPSVSGAHIVEIASEMKEFDDLTEILDSIYGSKLIFNGTKQELIDRTGGSEAYITRLLYAENICYNEIEFSDGEVLYRGFGNRTLTYEDSRVKVSITFSDNVAISYHFEDKTISGVNYTGTNNNESGYDDNFVYWTTSIGMWELEPSTSIYGDIPVKVPNYELLFRYSYGETEDFDIIFIYGSSTSEYSVPFGIYNLPPTITIA